MLSNALKFTEKGWVALKVVPIGSEEGKVRVCLTVEDTGIGMTEEQVGRIFQPFEQADRSMTRRYGGTGLGLAISLRLVELMGGALEVSSKPSVGSSFSFTITLEVDTETQPRALPKLEALDGLTVLIVDDNSEAREILTEDLKNHAGEILTAGSGSEALEIYRQRLQGKGIDIVLMDWKMPGLDGIETMRRIFSLSGNEKPPVVIMMSAYDYETATNKAIEAGAHTFLRKPFTAETLQESLESALRTSAEFVTSKPDSSGLGNPGNVKSKSVSKIAGSSILIVEDNKTNAEIVRLMLSNCGASAITVSNADLVFPALASNKFDAVLLDLQLPGTDGYTIAREIRKHYDKTQLPVIALTADVLEGVRERCIAAGMDDFLAKPIDQETLERMLERWVFLKQPGRIEQQVSGVKAEKAIHDEKAGLTDDVLQDLIKLRLLIEENDFRALRMAEAVMETTDLEGMREVKKSIANFDFDSALQHLNSIIEGNSNGKR